jgi:hypothetical protein
MALSNGMTPEQVNAEEAEAARETAFFKLLQEVDHEAYLSTLTPHQRYYRKHRARRAHEAALDRAAGKNAVPSWLTEEDLAEILALFELAVALETKTGIPHSVDHIIPITGICRKTWRACGRRVHTVCGLHVPENLRVVPLAINRDIKSDWFDSDWSEPIEVEPLYGFEGPDSDERPF